MKKRLLLLGGGGHCRSILDSAVSMGVFDEIGIVDRSEISFQGVSVVGKDDDLPALKVQGWTDAFVAVGSIGDTSLRKMLYRKIKDLGFTVPSIIDPTAALAANVSIGEGTFIGKRAVVNSEAVIGECAIINSGSIVEHDCNIGDFSHISPGSILCGKVSVGSGSHIGAGSVIRQGITIGEDTLVGIGSVVVSDIPSGKVAYGNPCRVKIQ